MLYGYQTEIIGISSLFYSVSAIPSNDDTEVESDLNFNSMESSLLILAITTIAFLSVLVMVVAKCMDCYNSEVSSENHPACADKEYKWGGAVGYTSANSSNPNAGFSTGERVDMTQQQSLPYAMIPTNVPSSAGFQGYSLDGPGQGTDSQPSAPQGGYQGFVRSDSSSYGGGSRHYNPAEPQEPPPAYNEAAARGGSFYGNR